MTERNSILITVDAGHGGWDNGASFEGRLEKNDNLALALEVQRQMLSQGIDVLMTRDTDVYITLEDRVNMANSANAGLFISLHRNSYIEQTPETNGVENFIYLTAPIESDGRAAQLVLDRVVDVGVQSNRGLSRGNYYVVRNANMPSMLLEMGFIINEVDNILFDEHLVEYAAAITKGAMQYFGLEFVYVPGITPTPPMPLPPEPETEAPCPSCPVCMVPGGIGVQQTINERFSLNMPLSGVFDDTTKTNMVKALQIALNSDFNAGLSVDGILGPETLNAFPSVRRGQIGNVVLVLQALLQMNGYVPGYIDGVFGELMSIAVHLFQNDNGLIADGIVGRSTLIGLL